MCRYTAPTLLALDCSPQAPAAARRFLREAVCRAHGAAVLEAAELATSEVVTNAVRHGTPPITVQVACDDHHGLQVSVTDGSDRRPEVRHARPGDTGGRGMQLVDLVSDGWGVVPSTAGKTVWFTLRAGAGRA